MYSRFTLATLSSSESSNRILKRAPHIATKPTTARRRNGNSTVATARGIPHSSRRHGELPGPRGTLALPEKGAGGEAARRAMRTPPPASRAPEFAATGRRRSRIGDFVRRRRCGGAARVVLRGGVFRKLLASALRCGGGRETGEWAGIALGLPNAS